MKSRILLTAGLFATALVVTSPAQGEEKHQLARTWRDASGKHCVSATLVRADASEVWLKKQSGDVRRVPLDRLSNEDQQFVAAHQAQAAGDVSSAAQGAWRALRQAGQNQLISDSARHWIDDTGRHDAEAYLVGVNDSAALLKRIGGSIIEVPLARLSERDRAYIEKRVREKDWSPMNVLRPVAAQVVPQVEGMLNGEAPSLEVFPTPDAVHIRVGKAYLNQRFARDIDKQVKVRDQILGTPVRGNAIVAGDVQVVPIDSDAQGSLMVIVTGTARSRTVGTHHPVFIHSSALTQFRGTKQIFMTPNGVTFEPARVSATTNSRTTGISTSLPGLRDRIARRIASRRVEESRPAADRISAEHNRQRVAADIDKQVEESLKRTDTFLAQHQERVREAFGLKETKMTCCSTDNYLEFAFLGQDLKDDAPAPPEFTSESDLEIVLHTPSLTPSAIGPGARMMLTNLFNAMLDDLLERRAENRGKEKMDCRLVWSRDQQWLAIMADAAPPVRVSQADLRQ